MKDNLNVLFISAEATPFVKVGGLADVAGALPAALRALPSDQTGGLFLDVRLVLPFHNIIKSSEIITTAILQFPLTVGEEQLEISVYESVLGGVPTYLIDGDPISKAESVYSSNGEQDREKYIFFSIAAFELARYLEWKVDVIHANDWHTALTLYLLKTRKSDLFYENTKGLITIHNLPYMGGEVGDMFHKFGIEALTDGELPEWARTQMLPIGLWAADTMVAVSETYAKEIMTPDYGSGLHEFLKKRRRVIRGITNGLDIKQWDPKSDEYIFTNFNWRNIEDRIDNKSDLIRTLGLDEDLTIPLIGMVTRVDYQKGIDLTINALRLLSDLPWQFVLLGSGDAFIEGQLQQLQTEFSERVRIISRFDNEISHQIYAGADIFLMPSRYEPCGLSQMIAMRYGCVPVVHATGGLIDTVKDGETGFVFQESKSETQAEAIRNALVTFKAKKTWQSLQKKGMRHDFSWGRSAKKYATIYRSLSQQKLPEVHNEN